MMKNIIITGTSRGIGRSLVEVFLNHGHRVIAISRDSTQLKQDFEQHPKLHCLSIDLTEPNALKAILSEIEGKFNIDILINNAGLLINKPFCDSSIEDIRNQMNINFIAPALLIQTLFNHFNQNGAHIVNISSMGGIQGSSKFPGLSIYSSVKGALNVLTECLATEFKETSIKVNALALGAVQTEMLKEAFPDYDAPLNPSEMSEYIYDFALNGSKYFNGKILQVALNNP